MIRATTALEYCSLLEGVAFGEVGLLVLFWWGLVCCNKEWITVAGLFFVILLFILGCVHPWGR